MKDIEIFDQIFEQYKKEKFFVSEEERQERMIEYVYESNKLEGNQLNLLETKEIITENISMGNKPLMDYLEAKGHFKALRNTVLQAWEKKLINETLIKDFNRDILSYVWMIEDFYYENKKAGQKLGEYKAEENRIYYNYKGDKGTIVPESDPYNIGEKMKSVLESINKSDKHIIQRTAELAYRIFINQPFMDGNKRTSRLCVTFMTMKEGLPLVIFNNQKGIDYNEAMLLTFLEKEPSIFLKFLTKEFSMAMEKMIEQNKEITKNAKKGYSLSF